MTNNIYWQSFIEQLQKDKNPLYQLLKKTEVEDSQELIIYHPTEEGKAEIEQKWGKIQAKLTKMNHPLQGKRVIAKAGEYSAPTTSLNTLSSSSDMRLPLQVLNHSHINLAHETSVQEFLQTIASNDTTCQFIYQQLTERTKALAETVLEVSFPWRVRVGGMRGFQELLLPVFHPVYGIPYIPSSSLKGALKAWARQHHIDKTKIDLLLGKLERDVGCVGCVQILDAFPTAPCLSIDMANPQWSWDNDRVKYNPVPHPLLSMKEPTLVIGLRRTSRGKKVNQADDLDTVKHWLENALATGIGSRVSAGYGRTKPQASLPYHSSHEFKMWTQGMYGADTRLAEFRQTALRGVLRYWFRAIALGLYSTETCKRFEKELFGELSSEGSVRIGVDLKVQKQPNNGEKEPCFYQGSILLESKSERHLKIIEKLLYLMSHISGIGRGSRRPLHLNDRRMRGCHWELDDKLPFEKEAWVQFLESVKDSFTAVYSAEIPGNGYPGNDRNRYQDVLNSNTKMYLVPSPQQRHPSLIQNWHQDGYKDFVLGSALSLLYSNNQFKGENRQGNGNPLVGGTLQIPSFVIIQSNFPSSGKPYQVVTVFGADHRDRRRFIDSLPANSISVWD
jgi:CRISPR-associated protein Cmr6